MTAVQADLTIEQGADFEAEFQFTDEDDVIVDFTGATFEAKIRVPDTKGAEVADMSTANGRIICDVPTGTVTLTLPASETALITAHGVMDLEVTYPGGQIDKLVRGKVWLTKEVTY